jgi:hypothetical protein
VKSVKPAVSTEEFKGTPLFDDEAAESKPGPGTSQTKNLPAQTPSGGPAKESQDVQDTGSDKKSSAADSSKKKKHNRGRWSLKRSIARRPSGKQ